MSGTSVRMEGGVAVARLDKGVTNAIDLEMARELMERLDELGQDPGVKGVVLTGNEKFLSIGFDIPQLYELDQDGFKEFYRAFEDLCVALYTFPKPTAAAVSGHATAGGCILALCCDQRFVRLKKLMGLNESRLGLPVPYLTELILRRRTGDENADLIIDGGKFYFSNKLTELGLADKVFEKLDVVASAVDWVGEMGGDPERYAALTVGKDEVVEEFMDERELKEDAMVEAWFDADNRKLIGDARSKF